jgi:hypothetical protein
MFTDTTHQDSPTGDYYWSAFEDALLTVPRTPEEPAPQVVYMAMTDGVPYTATELHKTHGEEWDTTRWTVKERLDSLAEGGHIEKKKHGHNTVTYWIPVD